MTLDECITYLEHVFSERKPRSQKARQILWYLIKLKERRESDKRVCDKLQAELFDNSKGYLDYKAGYDDGIKKAIDILKGERGEDEK